MCRKAHGAPFATYLLVDADDYRLVAGAEAIRRGESSPNFIRVFCATCGSVVPIQLNERRVAIPAGCLDDDPGIRASAHIFVASKAAWHPIADDLPRYDGYPADSDRVEIDRPAGSGEMPGRLRGSCLCGGVAFEVGEPFKVVYNCHCSRCRKARAAAYNTIGFTSADGVRFLNGEELLVHYKVPDSRFFIQTFCRVCGSVLPTLKKDRDIAVTPLGALDDDPGRGADNHIFAGSKAPWYEITDDLPQFDAMPTS